MQIVDSSKAVQQAALLFSSLPDEGLWPFFPLKFSIYEFNVMVPVCFFRGDSELHLQFSLKGLHMVLEIFLTFNELTEGH